MKKTVLFAASVAFALAFAQPGAQAFTTTFGQPAQATDIVPVAGGCGPGWHRGPYGGCRRNYSRAYRCFWRGNVRICR